MNEWNKKLTPLPLQQLKIIGKINVVFWTLDLFHLNYWPSKLALVKNSISDYHFNLSVFQKHGCVMKLIIKCEYALMKPHQSY